VKIVGEGSAPNHPVVRGIGWSVDTRLSEAYVPADHMATQELEAAVGPKQAKPPQPRPDLRATLVIALLLVALAGAGVVLLMRSATPSAPRPRPRPPVVAHKAVAPIIVHITYRTADRVVGYFEETLTISNRTGAELRGWTVSFSVPGTKVHNIWGAALRRTGPAPIITGTTTIPAGGSVEVRFGATGAPTAPRSCTLDGRPCTFGD
jgi:Cellulose binding domain